MRVTSAFFQSFGKMALEMDLLNISDKILDITGAAVFKRELL